MRLSAAAAAATNCQQYGESPLFEISEIRQVFPWFPIIGVPPLQKKKKKHYYSIICDFNENRKSPFFTSL